MNLGPVFFLEMFIALLFVGYFFLLLKFKQQIVLFSKRILAKQIHLKQISYFSTMFTHKLVLRKMFGFRPHFFDKIIFKSFFTPYRAFDFIHAYLKKHPKHQELLLLFAELCLLLNKRALFRQAINNINLSFFAKKTLKAYYYYLNAHNYLYETNMDKASFYANKALHIYRKKNYLYEEGLCYLLLFHIYKISGFSDIAFTMLKEAEKLFKLSHSYLKEVETQAYFGLWAMGEKNYDDALHYFSDALNFSYEHHIEMFAPHIYNWQGLIYFLKNDYDKASSLFLRVESSCSLPHALALADEMLGRIYLKKHEYKQALLFSRKAYHEYVSQKNISASLEMKFLEAEIFYEQGKLKQSQQILEALIREKISHSETFYFANAYTLLGLIYLKEKNFNLAKTLFMQAIDLENSKNRIKGAAIDYNNLAEIAFIEGDKTSADKYLRQAFDYAVRLEDTELKDYLEKKMS